MFFTPLFKQLKPKGMLVLVTEAREDNITNEQREQEYCNKNNKMKKENFNRNQSHPLEWFCQWQDEEDHNGNITFAFG